MLNSTTCRISNGVEIPPPYEPLKIVTVRGVELCTFEPYRGEIGMVRGISFD